MPNTPAKRPSRPMSVLVRDHVRPTMWAYGLMDEWRWVDEDALTWEGHVRVGLDEPRWVSGNHLKRLSGSLAEQVSVRSEPAYACVSAIERASRE